MKYLKIIYKMFAPFFHLFGIDILKLMALKHYPRYLKDKREWLKQGGKIDKRFIMLSDFEDYAGVAKGHYFHQDLLVAGFINAAKPKRHVDIGSRIDGFVAHVASFRNIEVVDIRNLEHSVHKNITFLQADFMEDSNIGKTDSLSCLHAIEHFGLGRYGDPVDVNGHIKGITNLIKMVKTNGLLYISFPISYTDKTCFNAHRILNPQNFYYLVKDRMKLIRFDYIDDYGDLKLNVELNDLPDNLEYACGIFTLKKIRT